MGYIDANLLGEITVTINGEQFVRYEDVMQMECEQVVPVDRVLEIIDEETYRSNDVLTYKGYAETVHAIRKRLAELEGGEHGANTFRQEAQALQEGRG